MKKVVSFFLVTIFFFSTIAGTVIGMSPIDGEDAKEDIDKDNLTNYEEYIYGTDPLNEDSDNGGAPDGWEIWYENHRAAEYIYFDGVNWFIRTWIAEDYHFDPNSGLDEGKIPHNEYYYPIQVKDWDSDVKVNDPDNDYWNNLHEFYVGTDPTNPDTDKDGYIDSEDPDPLVKNTSDWNPNGRNRDPGTGHAILLEGIKQAVKEGHGFQKV